MPVAWILIGQKRLFATCWLCHWVREAARGDCKTSAVGTPEVRGNQRKAHTLITLARHEVQVGGNSLCPAGAVVIVRRRLRSEHRSALE